MTKRTTRGRRDTASAAPAEAAGGGHICARLTHPSRSHSSGTLANHTAALTLSPTRDVCCSDQHVVGWGRAEWEKAKADGAVSEEAFQDAIARGEFNADDGACL